MKALINVPGFGLARLTDDLLWEADNQDFELLLNTEHHFDPDRYQQGEATPGWLELTEVVRRFHAEVLFPKIFSDQKTLG